MHKAKGMVRDVFRTRNMRALPGNVGLGQVRYPTAGNAYSEEEAQPFYVNAPFGIVLVHNGNLTNAQALKAELFDIDHRHINTESDSEVLLNVLAHELELAARDLPLQPDDVFAAVAAVHKRIKGSYAVIALIAGHGCWPFATPSASARCAWAKAQRRWHGDGGQRVRGAGRHGHTSSSATWRRARRCSSTWTAGARAAVRRSPQLHPCMFEYVYLARPDSVMDGISVYQARLNLGETLAKRVISTVPPNEIDVVIPIPESSRPSAMQLAQLLGKPYREGFVKNRYVGRTFIMPGQAVRKKSCARSSTPSAASSRAATCCWWTTPSCAAPPAKEIVQMAREAGARKVYMASAAPPVRYPNVYGIDMPTSSELVAHGRTSRRSARSSAATP
jgi:amidophosphoribosyltransferase